MTAPRRAGGPPWRIEHCALPVSMGFAVAGDSATIAIASRHGQSVELCLFDNAGNAELARLPLPCRTGDIHHGLVPGMRAGQRYGLRVHGPFAPEQGHLFDATKLLVDPHARRIDSPYQWSPELARYGVETGRLVPKGILERERPPRVPLHAQPKPSLIYELGVKAFSMLHPDVPTEMRGTLAALGHPSIIGHLKSLGVSHVELLPIAAWIDERHLPPLGLSNAWGYNPVTFLAPDPRVAPGGSKEVIQAAKRLRDAGIGIILDVIFNHTGESDVQGATLSLRGLDNAHFYRHEPDDPGRMVNDTGCGNTLACDQPAVIRLIMDALRHWWRCGVDGFRFDLAVTLGRDPGGYSADHPLFSAILQDPELSACLLIAEPWDLGPGGYRLGEFPGRFSEWNGRYRDDIRRFWRGDRDMSGALARGLAGSADLFAAGFRPPSASINYVCAHDGFTLADLVSHEARHNDANGEDGRDGTSENHSWNCGIEGVTEDAAITDMRTRDMRALIATVFVSRGTPMLLAGDEGGRSQHGNNNAYCQDTPEFWLDWVKLNGKLSRFVGALSSIRASIPALHSDRHLTGRPISQSSNPDVAWILPNGARLKDSDWETADCFAMVLCDEKGIRTAILFNRTCSPVQFQLPPAPSGFLWTRVIASTQTADDLTPARSVDIRSEAPREAVR